MAVAVLITNYNTWPLTIQCVEALLHFSAAAISSIVIVDDASAGDMPALTFPKTQIIRNPLNLGVVASVNVGMSHIREDIVVLFDSDARPLMDVVGPLSARFGENPKLAAIGLLAVDHGGVPNGSWAHEPTLAGFILGQRLSAVFHNFAWLPRRESKLCVYSCGVAIRTAAFRDIGGWDEGFQWLDVDLDFSLRLQDRGWEVVHAGDLKILHLGGGSPQETAHRVIRFHRNRWRLLTKRGRIPFRVLTKLVLWMRHVFELAIVVLAGRLLFRDADRRADKLKSRLWLVRNVWTEYGN